MVAEKKKKIYDYVKFWYEITMDNYWIFLVVSPLARYCYKFFLNYFIIE